MIEALESYAKQGQTILLDWITSPAAYAQIGLLVAAYLRALVLSAWMRPRIDRPIRPAEENQSSFATARRFALMFLPLLLPVLA
jgi:potassium efflux system protein